MKLSGPLVIALSETYKVLHRKEINAAVDDFIDRGLLFCAATFVGWVVASLAPSPTSTWGG